MTDLTEDLPIRSVEDMRAEKTELDDLLASLDDLGPSDDEEDEDDMRFGFVDEGEVHIAFPKEAQLLYGVGGLTVSVSRILGLMAANENLHDAVLFAAIQEDFYPVDGEREYDIVHSGHDASMEERAQIRLTMKKDAEMLSGGGSLNIWDRLDFLEELWEPFAAEKQQALEHRSELTSRWKSLEQKYADFILERDGWSEGRVDRKRKELDEENAALLKESKSWSDSYDRLWGRIHDHAGFDPYPAFPEDWYWNIAWSPEQQGPPEVVKEALRRHVT